MNHNDRPNPIPSHTAAPRNNRWLIFIWLTISLLGCSLVSQTAPPSLATTPNPPQQATTAAWTLPTLPTPLTASTFSSETLAPLPLHQEPSSPAPIWGIGNWQDIEISNEQVYRLQINGRTAPAWGIIVAPSPNSQLDAVIELNGENQSQIIDDEGTNGVELLQFSADPASEYTITIRPALENNVGPAHIETFDPANLVPQIDLVDQVALGEIKRYPITISANTPILIELTPEGLFDPIFEIYSGDAFLRHFDQGTNGEPERFAGLYQETAADYLIIVGGFQGTAGNYRLTVTPIPLSSP